MTVRNYLGCGYILHIFFLKNASGTLQKVSFATPKDTAHIFSVLPLSYGLQLLHSLFIVLLSGIKQMLKIWVPCSICMFGVCCSYFFYLSRKLDTHEICKPCLFNSTVAKMWVLCSISPSHFLFICYSTCNGCCLLQIQRDVVYFL